MSPNQERSMLRLSTVTLLNLLLAQLVKTACNVGDPGLVPELGRSPGEGNSYPLEYSGEFHGLYSLWGCKESDMTESLSLCRVHPAKCWAGWSTSGNQDFREKINHRRYVDDSTLLAESEEELKSLSMKLKRGEWKSGLKTQHSYNEDHGIQSHHFMANRWGNNGNSDRLFSWVPKSLQMVTAAMKLKDTCSLEEKLWPI